MIEKVYEAAGKRAMTGKSYKAEGLELLGSKRAKTGKSYMAVGLEMLGSKTSAKRPTIATVA